MSAGVTDGGPPGEEEAVLRWRGGESVLPVRDLLAGGETVTVLLPDDVNHALYARLHGGEPPAPDAEQIDAEGDGALLEAIAQVAGLQDFAELGRALGGTALRVRVESPPKVIIEPRREAAG